MKQNRPEEVTQENDTQMAYLYMKRCSTLHIIKDRHDHTTRREILQPPKKLAKIFSKFDNK